MKVKLKGKEYDVDDEVGNAIKKLGTDKKEMEDANDELTDAINAAIGDNLDADDLEDEEGSAADDDDEVAILQAERDAALDELGKYREIADEVDEDDNF